MPNQGTLGATPIHPDSMVSQQIVVFAFRDHPPDSQQFLWLTSSSMDRRSYRSGRKLFADSAANWNLPCFLLNHDREY
jgi:hypothetical protein